MVTLADIESARLRIADRVRVSPCTYSRLLSESTGVNVYLKLENLQLTGSFKERGACNRLLQLTADERRRGVVAASAGNHAQGVAYHARALGVPATIVMPRRSPLVKVAQTRALGATVDLVAGGYDEAFEAATRMSAERDLVLVHGFDDADVIAGQGTIGLEILEQVPDVDAVLVAVGGGGLIAGVATAIKERRRAVAVWGVQSEAMPAMRAAQQEGQPVRIDFMRTIADGIAVGRVGTLPFEAVRQYVDEIVTVDEEEIAEAILTLLEKEKLVAEGAGAAPLAALIHRDLPLTGKTVVIVVGGGNIDVNLLSRIIDRGLIKSGRIMRVRVMVPDLPGSLARILGIVAEAEANILEVDHDRVAARLEFGQASVGIVAETRGFEHVTAILEAIRDGGFLVQ
ncbi:MAG: threonine ammonia-lyase [Deltaproteobacteria bacterium]|nr:threonine ammonia-lyase [Deltaproteobacteria bacterium]